MPPEPAVLVAAHPHVPGDPDYVLWFVGCVAEGLYCRGYHPEDEILLHTLLDVLDGFFVL